MRENAIRERAEHDALTGLENREKYNSRLDMRQGMQFLKILLPT